MNVHRLPTRIAFLCLAYLLTTLAIAQEATSDLAKQKEMESDARKLVEQLAEGDYEGATAKFDDTMRSGLKPAQLQMVWSGIIRSIGDYEQITLVRHESVDVYEIFLLTCKFEKAWLDTKVVFLRDGQVTGLFFLASTAPRDYTAPSYVKESAFQEEEIEFGSGPWKLPGTFSRPKGVERAPAIILVHGSGPNDRDESVGANKPFKDLAGGLASAGIAVLRYDKRTKTHGPTLPKDITVKEETVEDVIAAAEWLSNHTSVDASRVFVLGHSLGGYLVPRIATADKDQRIAGYVILAGSTRPLEDLMIEQARYVFAQDGELSDSDRVALVQLAAQVRQVKSLAAQTKPAPVFGVDPAYWLDLNGYRPHEEAKAIAKPMLILQGERDYQVTMDDFANWQGSLSDHNNVRLKSYPKLNHLMIEGSGRSLPAEYEIAGHVSSEVIQDITDWVGDL